MQSLCAIKRSQTRGDRKFSPHSRKFCSKNKRARPDLRTSNMLPDFKYSSNSSDTNLVIPLFSSGSISSSFFSPLFGVNVLHQCFRLGILGNSHSHVSRLIHEHDFYTIVWKIFHYQLTQHLVFLYGRSRCGIRCDFEGERLF